MSLNLRTNIVNFFKYRFNLDEDKANEEEIILSLRRGVEFKGTSLWTLIFAIFIASIGLNVNSTAVIIGAMLISPLMGPIMGIGLGAGILDVALMRHAVKNLIIATLIALITSSIYFLISPLSTAQSELLSRTTPTIWDVLIAFFGGLAGIVASSRKQFSNVIPGVAIATALMPPLCTAGYGIGTGQWTYFAGAFYLFIINCVFISSATFIMVRFLKFHSITYTNQALRLRVQKWVGIIALFTILPSIFLAYNFVSEEFFKQRLQNYINAEIRSRDIIVVNKQIDIYTKSAKLFLLGEHINDTLIKKMVSEKNKYGLKNANLQLVNSTKDKEDINLEDLKLSIIEDLFKKQQEDLQAKTKELEQLKQLLGSRNGSTTHNHGVIQEFESIFGSQEQISLSAQPVYSNNKTDSIIILYIKQHKKGARIDVNKVKKWLKLRLKKDEVKIFVER
jgi:uncharacterized hydrophobic protein (TIGR00271 family)